MNDTLRGIGANRREAWICAGDFNDITHHSKEVGGRRKYQNKLYGLNNMLAELGMNDIGSKGQRFTWTNNRRGSKRVMERLDWVIGNKIWCSKFYKIECINELAISFEHSPIGLILCHTDQKSRTQFRFEEMWLEKEYCYQVIKESWCIRIPTRDTKDLKTKIDTCKRSQI